MFIRIAIKEKVLAQCVCVRACDECEKRNTLQIGARRPYGQYEQQRHK